MIGIGFLRKALPTARAIRQRKPRVVIDLDVFSPTGERAAIISFGAVPS